MVSSEQAAGSETTGADYAAGAAGHAASDTASEPQFHQSPGEAEPSASLKEQARRFAEDGKSAAADRVGRVADATERAAGDLSREVPQAADALQGVAQQLNSAASALRERSIDEWISNARDFARERPLAFFAGAIATGFALSRFLKSSNPDSHRDR